MFKKSLAILLAALFVCSLVACGGTPSEPSGQDAKAQAETGGSESTTPDTVENVAPSASTVSNSLAEDKDALIAAYADQFEQLTYADSDTGLSITYNLYLPKDYDDSGAYPMVVFIGDSSCAGKDATVSLTQGRGGLVWAAEEWQSVYPTIVAVPTYPETILDDHGSYTTTEYVELTKRFIDYMSGEYAVDPNRIYGTGQSMGCMTTLILASEYPELYAACMFVDGQWDIGTLTGLENQTFVYFAAEDDTNAWNGAQEVMSLFDGDSVSYTYAQWDGNWTPDELSAAAQELFASEADRNFISWTAGTIEPKTGSMGGSDRFEGSDGFGGSRGPNGSKGSEGNFGGPSGNKGFAGKPGGLDGADGFGGGTESADANEFGGMNGSPFGGANSSAYHMASFDYAYNCVAVMEWLFQQSK